MAIGFKHGSSGGDPLNFTVVNASSQPTDPKENTIWITTNWAQNGWTFGADMPLRRTKSSNKNFVVYPYAIGTTTGSGVTLTDLGDGNFTVNGTATAGRYFRLIAGTAEGGMFLLTAGTYTLSGCPSGGSSSTYMVQLVTLDSNLDTASTFADYGSGKTFTLDKDTLCRMNFYVLKGATFNNANLYLQVEKGSSATSFKAGNANGQVWIKPDDTGTISFEALKRDNRIVLHPGEVYMYNQAGGWNRQKTVKVYQNGAWVDLDPAMYIYNKGGSTGYSLACDETMKQMSSGYYAKAGYVTVGSGSVTVATEGRLADFANIFVTDTSGAFVKVDLSRYTKIRVKGTLSGSPKAGDCVFRVMSEMGDYCTENNVASKSLAAGTIDATVDISSIASACYLGFTFYNSETVLKPITFQLTELWLE